MVYCNFKHIMVITLAFLYAQPTSSRLNQQRLGPGPECTAVKEADRTCYNGNKVYIAAFTANKLAHDGTMGHTYAVAWGDHEWCQELVARLPESENEEKFRTACVGIFGNDCCTQCRTIGRLFDRIDMTVFPPSNDKGGLGFHLDNEKCLACIEREECENPPRMSWKEPMNVDRKEKAMLEHTMNDVSLSTHNGGDERWKINT